MQTLQTKICIIGGGPGGASASLFLSKQHIPHILVDKKSFPKHKVCGECFDGRVWHNLNRLSPNYVDDMETKGIIVKSWKYSLNTQKANVVIDFPKDNTPRILTQRYKFDGYLMEQAKKSPYAQIIENQYITNIEHTANNVILKSKTLIIEAELGLLATGAFSKLTNHGDSTDDIYLFERTYYRNFAPKAEHEVEIYFFKKPVKGYLYICPAGPELYNIELSAHKQDLKKNNLKMSDVLHMALEEYPTVKKRLDLAEPIAKPKGTFMSFKHRKLNLQADKRLLNIGAAAFCINPITGAGVGNSMTMARLVTEAITEHLDQPNFVEAVTETYERRTKSSFKSLVKTNIVLNFFMNNLSLFEPFMVFVSKTKSFKNLLLHSNLINNIGNIRFHLKNLYQSYFVKS
jgi:flavin-dependent dehydrogenase